MVIIPKFTHPPLHSRLSLFSAARRVSFSPPFAAAFNLPRFLSPLQPEGQCIGTPLVLRSIAGRRVRRPALTSSDAAPTGCRPALKSGSPIACCRPLVLRSIAGRRVRRPALTSSDATPHQLPPRPQIRKPHRLLLPLVVLSIAGRRVRRPALTSSDAALHQLPLRPQIRKPHRLLPPSVAETLLPLPHLPLSPTSPHHLRNKADGHTFWLLILVIKEKRTLR